MCNRTQNDAIWGLIALFLTYQIAGNTIDFKMNVINFVIVMVFLSGIFNIFKTVLIYLIHQCFMYYSSQASPFLYHLTWLTADTLFVIKNNIEHQCFTYRSNTPPNL